MHSPAGLPLHIRRTLDQYGYSGLEDTGLRDHDQVLYKCTRRKWNRDKHADNGGDAQPRRQFYGSRQGGDSQNVSSRGDDRDPDDDDARVLMVDQLWCWVLDGGKKPLMFNPGVLANGVTLQKQ